MEHDCASYYSLLLSNLNTVVSLRLGIFTHLIQCMTALLHNLL
ncbi:hypothetical protein SOHN41_01765 [Shewanella sp. HN-41]|nr:hypothetical protein SOHN41_01765 [Shewanella sp. HN-41]